MNVLCDREKLREGLTIANLVVPPRSPKPILENICLVATDDALELVGTDLEVAIRYRIEDVKVTETGSTVIPARVAVDFIKDLTGETVELKTKGRTCHIGAGADTCELVTAEADEFPVVQRFDGERTFSIQAGTFSRLVNQTAFAAARDAGRYAMHGVLVEFGEGKLNLIATDGRRLAVSGAPIDIGDQQRPSAIVPTKGMNLFCRVLNDPLEQVRFQFDENQIGMSTANAEIFARLIDGEFPKYSAVIPTKTKHCMEADAEVLGRKLRLVANVTGAEARAVKLELKKNELEVSGQFAGRGEAHAHMEVAYKGDAAEIAFNPDYVVAGVKNCEKDVVQLEFEDKTSPGKFTLGEDYIYIVMPITVDA
ncbi:MAG: DNA polymerase III subunit beta [Planctomycetota bacterium]|jgi:DNA polymerase-3 subunit beta|nr:DNA polymerase III subunit beta [Planctomycetota bacterium]MDP6762700.1 DNA polymerase III subunit beta [Planctomycetota bacterium]MDP6988952.1 DNA polymerase III subunit beta [Planctomycetota bacterium]